MRHLGGDALTAPGFGNRSHFYYGLIPIRRFLPIRGAPRALRLSAAFELYYLSDVLISE